MFLLQTVGPNETAGLESTSDPKVHVSSLDWVSIQPLNWNLQVIQRGHVSFSDWFSIGPMDCVWESPSEPQGRCWIGI
jgi:hypothetical protein